MIRRDSCHAKSMAWTNCDSPWIYNVSNGFMVIWLFGQFRWSSCNKLALFSDLSDNYLLGALLESSLPSRVEREETLNTPSWGGFWPDTDVQRDLFHSRSTHSSNRGNVSTAGRVDAEKGGRNRKAYHLRTHRQPRRSTPTTPCPTTKS